MTDVIVVVGAQFGSEAKGAVTALFAKDMRGADVNIRVAGPNAGHTVYGEDGHEWKLRSVPVGAVASRSCQLHIAAGSEIDFGVLFDEVMALENAGYEVRRRLTIHPSATILTGRHQSQEREAGLVGRVGSTGKGIGAARADRIYRTATTFEQALSEMGEDGRRLWGSMISEPGPFDLDSVDRVVIEGTQGYGLGLHTKFYPQTTSSDCRAIDFLAMAGISPWDLRIEDLRIVLVARTYPIRVAGNSGPLRGETSWAQLGLPEERTTVTNNVRRVGEWDGQLVEEAIRANGGGDYNESVVLAITMLDQLFPEDAGKASPDELSEGARAWLSDVSMDMEADIVVVGTGPTTHFITPEMNP